MTRKILEVIKITDPIQQLKIRELADADSASRTLRSRIELWTYICSVYQQVQDGSWGLNMSFPTTVFLTKDDFSCGDDDAEVLDSIIITPKSPEFDKLVSLIDASDHSESSGSNDFMSLLSQPKKAPCAVNRFKLWSFIHTTWPATENGHWDIKAGATEITLRKTSNETLEYPDRILAGLEAAKEADKEKEAESAKS